MTSSKIHQLQPFYIHGLHVQTLAQNIFPLKNNTLHVSLHSRFLIVLLYKKANKNQGQSLTFQKNFLLSSFKSSKLTFLTIVLPDFHQIV